MMASTTAVASGVTTWCAWPGQGESVTDVKPFRNFLLHLYTCCSDRHASPYWTSYSIHTLAVVTDMHRHTELPFVDEFRWVSPLHFIKKWIAERCSSLVHVAIGATTFTLLLHRHVVFLHHTATCQPLFKPWVSLLPTYRTIEPYFEFLSHF